MTENLDTEDEPNKYSHLTDHQSIDAFLINVQGELKGGAVKTVLTTDIKDFIEHVSELPLDNEQASRRQGLLNQQLLALKDSNIYDQRIACAGNACILSLITDELSTEGKAHLAEFDSNISFISANTNDAGEFQFNAIYLYDEDPAPLVISITLVISIYYAKAICGVVIDHANRLHKSVANCWPYKVKT